jgi:hypothetical protein
MRVRVSLSIEFSCRLKFVVFIPSAGWDRKKSALIV